MPKWFYRACRECGLPEGAGVKISRQGFCPTCGMKRAMESIRDMAARDGAHYERHRERRPAMAAGGRARGVGGTSRKMGDDGKTAIAGQREASGDDACRDVR